MEQDNVNYLTMVEVDSMPVAQWPAGLPAPSLGDKVTWMIEDSPVKFRVVDREWDIGSNDAGETTFAVLNITGKSL